MDSSGFLRWARWTILKTSSIHATFEGRIFSICRQQILRMDVLQTRNVDSRPWQPQRTKPVGFQWLSRGLLEISKCWRSRSVAKNPLACCKWKNPCCKSRISTNQDSDSNLQDFHIAVLYITDGSLKMQSTGTSTPDTRFETRWNSTLGNRIISHFDAWWQITKDSRVDSRVDSRGLSSQHVWCVDSRVDSRGLSSLEACHLNMCNQGGFKCSRFETRTSHVKTSNVE